MKGYSCAELGMLIGAAVGGIVSALGFAFSGNYIFLILVVVGIFAGMSIGANIDRKNGTEKEKHIDL